jgi:hypothetical protein
MNAGLLLTPGVMKEIRALLPTWLASGAAVVAAALGRDNRLFGIAVFAYGVGMLALGAQSVGHEYTHRTLALFLSLPRDRHRLLLTKIAVLATMLVTLSALGWVLLLQKPEFAKWFDPRLFVVVGLAGFFLAPWLTMICRGTLAGIVFSVVVPAMFLIAGDLIGLAMYGSGGGARIDNFKFAFLWRGLFLACAVAAVSSWRMFGRLEAIDGRGADLQVPDWVLGGAPGVTPRPQRRNPYWLLIKKEFRLQQLTFVVVLIFLTGWAGLTLLARVTEHLPVIPIDALAVLYFGILTILIGSLASAEERQLGTLEWQSLLPVASWKQWMLKAGVVFGLVSLLGIALPAIIMGAPHPRAWASIAVPVLFITTLSLYVSSLSTSGVRAMVATLPSLVGMFVLMQFATLAIYRLHEFRGPMRLLPRVPDALALALVAGFVALALRYGYVNHKSAERNMRSFLKQAAGFGAYLVIALTALALL